MLRHWRLLAVFLPIVLFAQSERGSISGTVRDASGAVVPGARVIVTDPGTNTTLRTVTTETGDYTAPNLSAGSLGRRIKFGLTPTVRGRPLEPRYDCRRLGGRRVRPAG